MSAPPVYYEAWKNPRAARHRFCVPAECTLWFIATDRLKRRQIDTG